MACSSTQELACIYSWKWFSEWQWYWLASFHCCEWSNSKFYQQLQVDMRSSCSNIFLSCFKSTDYYIEYYSWKLPRFARSHIIQRCRCQHNIGTIICLKQTRSLSCKKHIAIVVHSNEFSICNEKYSRKLWIRKRTIFLVLDIIALHVQSRTFQRTYSKPQLCNRFKIWMQLLYVPTTWVQHQEQAGLSQTWQLLFQSW